MPPPSNHASLHLQVLPKRFFVARLQSSVGLPPCASRLFTESDTTSFFSVTRTSEEISLVGESHKWMPDSLKQYSRWRCIRVKGPMEHNLTGVMAAFTAILEEARVPVFVISTWNTDYVLVPMEFLSDAIKALSGDGWAFDEYNS